MYELYDVPNQELDGTEEFIDEAQDMKSAEALYEKLKHYNPGRYNSLWIIICSDEKGYEKVVRT